MKRLITILLSFIGFVSLYGQTVPMVVAGKMHVSGPIRSQGATHIYASVDTGKIEIDNATDQVMLVTDTIILYSNDTFDGMLKNVNTKTAGGGVKGLTANAQPKQVTVRKTMAEQTYTYLALPFDVDKVQKVDSLPPNYTGKGNGYYAAEFNGQGRANSFLGDGKNYFEEVWTEVPGGLKKGTGYLIYPVGTTGKTTSMDFVTTDTKQIDSLFNTYDKSINYTVYSTTLDLKDRTLGDGWAFIGGLNAATYFVSMANNGDGTGNIEDYNGTAVWYRGAHTSQTVGTTHDADPNGTENTYLTRIITQDDPGMYVNIGPYTPFYIQETPATQGQNQPGKFTFTYNEGKGLSLESVEYRSSNINKVKDRLYFSLASDKNSSFDRFYITFSDQYSESYKANEDAITMTTYYNTQPALYCLGGSNQPLALNGLPMTKGERKVGMGFSVPEAGDYTLRLDPKLLTDVKSVILVDNLTGKKIDLLQTPYSFTAEGAVKSDNNRFAMWINSSYTDIPSIDAGDLYAYAKDNVLTVKNLSEGDKVSVYDLAGRQVASGNVSGKEFSTVLRQKGVYVVNVKAKSGTKALKVLNK